MKLLYKKRIDNILMSEATVKLHLLEVECDASIIS